MTLLWIACGLLLLAGFLPTAAGTPLSVRYRRQNGTAPAPPVSRRLLAGLPVHLLLPLLPRGYSAALQRDLLQAGLADAWSLPDFIAIKLAISLVLTAFMAIVWVKTGLAFFAVAVPLQCLSGWSLPDFVVKRRAAARAAAAERELTTMLSTLAICLRTGLSLRSALLQLAVINPGGVLGTELAKVAGHLNAGATPREALTALMDRCHSPAVSQALSTILQHADHSPRAAGAAAAAESRQAWQRMRRRAELVAHTTSLKLFFPQLLLGLPALLLIVMGPAVLNIWQSYMNLSP